jgi:hypothetical protein
MRKHMKCRWRWIVLLLPAILLITGCTQPDSAPATVTSSATPVPFVEEPPAPTETSEPPTPTATPVPTAPPIPKPEQPQESEELPPSPTSASASELVAVSSLYEEDVLYNDEFTDTSSGWPGTSEFDNYYIGYHEPEYYHVEVHEPNDKALVALPGFEFDDMTVEAEVFTDSPNTAQEGDFRYGLALRRSGNQYYAFMISPTTKTWQVIKSSPSGLVVLDEGTDESIHDFDESDMLQIDANGPVFTFHIDGQPVSQVEDRDYASGDLAFIVETFDSPRAHIHYDSLTVREAQAPPISCMVDILVLNLREGPGLSYSPIDRLPNGTRLVPQARSENNLWIQVQVESTGKSGWVASYAPYVTCDFPVTDLPES